MVLMLHPLWQEDGSVVYNFCCPSPAQSFSGPSSAWLKTTFYCLRFETPPTWRVRSPNLYLPGTGWPGYTPKHFVPFSSPPKIRRTTVEVYDRLKQTSLFFLQPIGTDRTENTALLLLRVLVYAETRLLNCSTATAVCAHLVSCHLLCCCVRALPSNGCFSFSTVLTLSKHATIHLRSSWLPLV
jgi:hypothetical protein